MPVSQFDTNFSDLSNSEFIVTLGNMADLLATHPFFKDNWPDYLPTPQKLKEQVNAFNDAVSAAEADGGHKNLKGRDEKRQEAQASAVFMGQYVVMRSVSENDPSFLDSIGLKLKTKPSKNNKPASSVLPPPDSVVVKHGTESGTVVVSHSKVAGAGSYEVQICQGDPNVEASWSTVGQYSKCRTLVRALEPATKVHFRIRCHGAGDPGPYSNYVSIIVL